MFPTVWPKLLRSINTRLLSVDCWQLLRPQPFGYLVKMARASAVVVLCMLLLAYCNVDVAARDMPTQLEGEHINQSKAKLSWLPKPR